MPVDQPELRISVDDMVFAGIVSLEIDSVGHFAADRFRVVFAVGATPLLTTAYFASLGMQTITIEVAVRGGGYETLLVGQIDNVKLNILENTATLVGRDLAAKMIDAEISETFANQTASQIATAIAGRHGLMANVTATQTPVGQYYELDHARNALSVNARATTEWNLLTMLANAESFLLSVIGTTLNFGPWPAVQPIIVTPLSFIKLSIDSATALPSGAVVKSWNSRKKIAVTQNDGTGAATTIIRPNLTQGQATDLAKSHLATISQHATILTGTMPGDVTLTPGMQIVLNGTSSTLDQTYLVTSVCRNLDGITGFKQAVMGYALN